MSSLPRMTFKRIYRGKAENPEDVAKGRICSKSGYWFPGHDIVFVNGRPYGKKFAPEPERPRRRPFTDITDLF